jgi:nucleoside-diphosphate-sugar epimerase
VIDLAALVLELTGSASPVRHEPLPEDDPKVRKPDIRLARERLGWEPRIPLEEGLRRTIAYFRELQAAGELREPAHAAAGAASA